MQPNTKNSLGRIAFLSVLSAALLLLFSGCSPFYPTNPWVDANCFHTIARGIVQGKLPYTDLIEQKGPLLYMLHVPSVLISPNGFFGVYLLQLLALTLFLNISYKTVCLIKENCPVWLMTFPALFYLTSRAYAWGDSAEELCMPIFALALYDLVRILKKDKFEVENKTLLLNGFFAGCIFWIKFSLLGLHFGWMAFLAIYCVIRERKILHAARMCLIFLAGMAATAVPWIVLYGAHGGLSDLWNVYFVQNTVGYTQEGSSLLSAMIGLFGGSCINPCIGISIASGMVWSIIILHREQKKAACIVLPVVLFCSALFQYMGNRYNGYYYLVFADFAPLVCIPLADVRRVQRRTLKIAVTIISCMAVCIAICTNNNIKRIGTPKETLVTSRFTAQIEKNEDTTILNYGFLDGGFYLDSGIEPSCKWFCLLLANSEQGKSAQNDYVSEQKFDYIITSRECLFDGYECIDCAEEKYDYKRDGIMYYLYRKCKTGVQTDFR